MQEMLLVFAYPDFYPSGGMEDCEGFFVGPGSKRAALGLAKKKMAEDQIEERTWFNNVDIVLIEGTEWEFTHRWTKDNDDGIWKVYEPDD